MTFEEIDKRFEKGEYQIPEKLPCPPVSPEAFQYEASCLPGNA